MCVILNTAKSVKLDNTLEFQSYFHRVFDVGGEALDIFKVKGIEAFFYTVSI